MLAANDLPTNAEQPREVLERYFIDLVERRTRRNGREFERLRDTAIIRLFVDTGVRVSGLVGTTPDDYNFDTDTVHVVLKGGSDLVLPFGARTSDALRRYRRAADAELPDGVNPHLFRHYFAHTWLAAGGQETT